MHGTDEGRLHDKDTVPSVPGRGGTLGASGSVRRDKADKVGLSRVKERIPLRAGDQSAHCDRLG